MSSRSNSHPVTVLSSGWGIASSAVRASSHRAQCYLKTRRKALPGAKEPGPAAIPPVPRCPGAPAARWIGGSVARLPVCPFARLPVCPFARLLVCSFARLLVCSFARLLVCSFARLLVCSFARLLVCSFARLLVCSFAGQRTLPARRIKARPAPPPAARRCRWLSPGSRAVWRRTRPTRPRAHRIRERPR